MNVQIETQFKKEDQIIRVQYEWISPYYDMAMVAFGSDHKSLLLYTFKWALRIPKSTNSPNFSLMQNKTTTTTKKDSIVVV